MQLWGIPSFYYPLYDFDLRATHARTLLPAALASVSFGFVLVRVRVPLFLVHNPAFVVVDLKKNLIIVEYHGRFLACVDNVLKITRIFLNYAQTPK